MVKDPLRRHGVRRHDTVIGADAVLRATGSRRDEWFTLLDEQQAAAGDHPSIVARLAEEGVDPWWAHSVAVGYEQARGLRHPGRRADRTFEAAVSRAVAVAPDMAFAWLADAALRSRWLEVEPEVLGATRGRSVRWGWPDGGRVTLRLTALPDGRTRVAVRHRVEHDGRDDGGRMTALEHYWADRLDALRELAAQD